METEGLRRAQQYCSARALCKRKQRWHCLDCGLDTIEFGHYFIFGPLQAVPRTTLCFVSIAFNDALAGSRSLRTSPPSFRAPGSHMSCIHKIAKARLSALVRGFSARSEGFFRRSRRAAGVASDIAGESGSVVARRPVALAIRRQLILSPPCGLLQHGKERLGFGVMVAKGGVQCLTSQRQPFRIVLVGFDGPCLERLDCSAVLGCHSHGQSSDLRRLSISKSLFSIWVRV
jgi:hypothetical protein